jgi:hypothetical protein
MIILFGQLSLDFRTADACASKFDGSLPGCICEVAIPTGYWGEHLACASHNCTKILQAQKGVHSILSYLINLDITGQIMVLLLNPSSIVFSFNLGIKRLQYVICIMLVLPMD